MKLKVMILLAIGVMLTGCKKTEETSDLTDGLYAVIETPKGPITVQLEYKKTPVTVANFVTLAEGKNKYVLEKYRDKPFYDNLKWHRVLANFMIQGGDPEGTGSGDTGYKFKDEFTDLKHDKPGIISMANSGPGTNSSQFFITHVPTPWLDGKHTAFGHVVKGQEVVDQIAQDDPIQSVKIIRVGADAKKFDAVKTFDDYFSADIAKRKNKMDSYAALRAKATKLPSGLEYLIVSKGSGEKPKPKEAVAMNYVGYLENGSLFDSNIADAVKEFDMYNPEVAAQGGYSPVSFPYGQQMIPGFTEGLSLMGYGDKAVLFIPSGLGYGPEGRGGVIPPNSNLIFEVELVKVPGPKTK
ncbi:peptidylprolyl isomerase [Flavobacterium silvaticum]|uniref:peptidylprolyl isomerase n=1 Tax=Flavobacterium silvaticum TaxID=1852020 RepID=A0A972FKT9_9FLAO|nr:peptidylprolyl isomerase [Flavobacterium silvaticum]NMH27864.1 peptidylprolyl isomerase [Flavobacterium silvaticum]